MHFWDAKIAEKIIKLKKTVQFLKETSKPLQSFYGGKKNKISCILIAFLKVKIIAKIRKWKFYTKKKKY